MPLLQTEVFVGSRSKTALMHLTSLVFVAIAVFLPADGQSQDWRLYCGGFFGLGAIVFIFLLVRPQRLTLDAEGFSLSGGLMLPSRVKKIAWRDVKEFFVWQSGRGNKMIGLNFEPGASERTRFARLSRSAFGADGALPGLWLGGVENVVRELNNYREHALRMSEKYGSPTAPRSSAG